MYRLALVFLLCFTFFKPHFVYTQNEVPFADELAGLNTDIANYKWFSINHRVTALNKVLYNNSSLTPYLKGELDILKIQALVNLTNYAEALDYAYKVLNENVLEPKQVVEIQLQIAKIKDFNGEYGSGLEILDEIASYYDKYPKDMDYSESIYRRISMYVSNKSYAVAKAYVKKAFDYNYHCGYSDFIAKAYIHMAYASPEKSLEERKDLFLEAYAFFGSSKLNYYSIGLSHEIAKLDILRNDLKSALFYINKGLKGDRYDLNPNASILLLNDKIAVFENQKKYDSALVYTKKLAELEKRIVLIKESAKIMNLNDDIERLKQQEENIKVITELEASETENEKQKQLLQGIGLIGLLVVFFSFRLYSKNRKIDQQRKEIKKQNNNLAQTVKQRDILLKELNHRVKNNLALIISLIKFQSEEIGDSIYQEKFKHLENRISTIAIAHEQFIYSEDQSEGALYNLEEYLQKISEALMNLSSRTIIFNQTIAPIEISIDTALPIGILMNELISNSIEHAQTPQTLKIENTISCDDSWIHINYKDSGTVFETKDDSNSLGLFIIESMVQQLKGTIERNAAHYIIKLKQK